MTAVYLAVSFAVMFMIVALIMWIKRPFKNHSIDYDAGTGIFLSIASIVFAFAALIMASL